MARGDFPLCEALIEVVRNSQHISSLERNGIEKVLMNPLFGAREASIEAILQDFLVKVNIDPKATSKIQVGSLALALGGRW